MPPKIIVAWESAEKTVLMVSVFEDWTWADMDQAIDEINRALDRVSHPVYTIMDFTLANHIPDNVLANLKRLNRSHHPNQDKTAVVNLGVYGQNLINMFIQLHGMLAKGNDVKLVNNLQAAYEFFGIEMNTTDET